MDFDEYAVPIDSDLVSQDFDDIDLEGTKMIEDDETPCDIKFE